MNTIEKYVKKSIAIICLLLATISYAQQGINYQGVARDANNELLANADITLDLNIIKTSLDGETMYSETHTISTDANGVFSVVIGNGTPTLNLFEDINWAEDKHFLNVSLNGTEIGTTEFKSVPYTQAMGKWQAHKNGVTPKRTGGSIYIGENAGENDDYSDNHNIGIGKDALQRSEIGSNNIAIGEEAMKLVTEGRKNVAIGKEALFNTSSGISNVAIGHKSLYSNTSGTSNIAFGFEALHDNTIGDVNIALGPGALKMNRTGWSNIGIGSNALKHNTEGKNNIAHGDRSLYHNVTGDNNIALGFSTLLSNTEGNDNIANGFKALWNNTIGNNNIANGYGALYNNTEGDNNIANGFEALYFNTTGNNNIANGNRVLRSNTIGSYNLALGSLALTSNINGYNNIALGLGALTNNISENGNIAIGLYAGGNSVGEKNVFLGYEAGIDELGGHKLYIDNNGSSFPLIYGEFDNEILGFNAKVGIGTQTPAVPLHILTGSDAGLSNESGYLLIGAEGGPNIVMDSNEIQARNNGVASTLHLQNDGGDVRVGGAVVHASDKRLKRDINDISYGLNEILQLRPAEYFWKGKTQEHKSLGLIAQEVDEVIKNVVTYDKEQDKYGVSYTELIPVLIKALQEQQMIIDLQQKRNNSQSKDMADLESRLDLIENKLSHFNEGNTN